MERRGRRRVRRAEGEGEAPFTTAAVGVVVVGIGEGEGEVGGFGGVEEEGEEIVEVEVEGLEGVDDGNDCCCCEG